MDEDKLIKRWIEPDPFIAGAAEARLVESGVHVWALVGYWYGVECDTAEVARAYDVPGEAIEAALAYYRRHKQLIDARLEANAAPVT